MSESSTPPSAQATHFGVGSTTSTLRRVLLRRPTTDGDFLAAGWRTPDPARLLAEHDGLVQLLQSLGCQVDVCDAVPGLVDAVYCQDPMIMTPYGAILLQMAKPVRSPEPAALRVELERLGVPILGELTGSARCDGGDKVWFDDRTLALGRGYRTNAEAVRQIRAMLAPHDVDVITFDMPHYRGAGEVLHLMSVISPIADDLAVVYEPIAPVPLLEFLTERGIAWVTVDDEEFATQGSNVLAVASRVAVAVAGNNRIIAKLRAAGVTVHEFAGGEVAVKGDGGPTCLTQPLWRD